MRVGYNKNISKPSLLPGCTTSITATPTKSYNRAHHQTHVPTKRPRTMFKIEIIQHTISPSIWGRLTRQLQHAMRKKTLVIKLLLMNFGVKRTTLSRRHRGVQTSCENVTATHHNLLSKPQQNELINYINKLSNKGLPPIIPVVRILAIDICKIKPSKNWI